MNMDAATDMYIKAMEWRRTNHVDTIMDWYREPDVMRKYFPCGFAGYDKQGYAVIVERIGHVDFVGMEATVGEDAFLRWVAFYHERQERMMREATEAASRRAGRPTLRDKLVVIVDLNGLGTRHISSATLSVLKKRTRTCGLWFA